jgi:hypothetical protein
VPAFFALMDDLGALIWRIFGRFVGKADEGPAHGHPAPAHAAATPAPAHGPAGPPPGHPPVGAAQPLPAPGE